MRPFLHTHQRRINPLTLFRSTDLGFYFDHSRIDLMRVARDGTGAAPVNSGDAVGHVTDLVSGRVKASPTDNTFRPTLSIVNGKTGILFDGINDSFTGTAAWNFSGSSPEATLIIACIDDAAGTSAYMMVESTTNASVNANAILLDVSNATAGNVDAGMRGGATFIGRKTSVANTMPFRQVITTQFDMDISPSNSADAIIISQNKRKNAYADSGAGSSGTHYGNHTWYFGARAGVSLRFKGTVFAELFITRHLTHNEHLGVEAYMADLAGIQD